VCDRFLRAVQAQSGPAVAKMTRSVLSGICGYAARNDLLERNPVRDTGPISTKPKRPPRALTIEQVVDLRAWLTYDDAAVRRDIPDLVAFLLGTGLRISEASAVHWDDIDLAQGRVQVAGNVVRLKGQGLVLQREESSKLTVRALALPTWCRDLLTRRHHALLAQGHDPAGPVFPSAKGGLRDPSNTQADLREAFTVAGYPWVTSHVFRKTVATVMDEAGRTAREVADQLGHAHPSMSQDRYLGRRRTTGAATALEALRLDHDT
jgi:integrase